MAVWVIMELGVCTLGELGKRMGRDVTTLSSAVKRLQGRAKEDLKLAKSMKELLKTVS
jgi:chromosomal replication initiation ATPase DnaA